MVRRALALGALARVIAADGGARAAAALGCAVHTVIGDMDSLTPDEIAALRAQGTEVIRHPEEKDETDLELALQLAAADATWIRIIGALGGRLDQLIANIYLLALPELAGCDVRLVDNRQEAWLMFPGECVIDGAAGDTLSLIPINGAAQGVQTTNLYYPLNDETLAFGPARGVSNVFDAAQVRVALREGLLLVVHTVGRA